jgi:hypothetical protein
MGSWIDAIEAKARIIHQELQSARELARRVGQEPEEISGAYLEMLAKLYREDFSYALLADNADLIARYRGPGVAHREPPISLVTTVFGRLRAEIQKVAKAIAGMEEKKVRWPADLDPQLAGLTYGSLVVGMRVPQPGDVGADGQAVLPGVSDDLYRAVQTAVQSLPAIPRLIQNDQVSDAIDDLFPDPAVRDTVMVAARRLAPSARNKAIDELFLSGPHPDEDLGPAKPLTKQSRQILGRSLNTPNSRRLKGHGDFEGVVREVDLDARRFEIRGRGASSGMRCIYEPIYDGKIIAMLNAAVRVNGSYEAAADEQPRLVRVEQITVTRAPDQQLELGVE